MCNWLSHLPESLSPISSLDRCFETMDGAFGRGGVASIEFLLLWSLFTAFLALSGGLVCCSIGRRPVCVVEAERADLVLLRGGGGSRMRAGGRCIRFSSHVMISMNTIPSIIIRNKWRSITWNVMRCEYSKKWLSSLPKFYISRLLDVPFEISGAIDSRVATPDKWQSRKSRKGFY